MDSYLYNDISLSQKGGIAQFGEYSTTSSSKGIKSNKSQKQDFTIEGLESTYMPSFGDISSGGEILDTNVFQTTGIDYNSNKNIMTNKDGFETQYETSNNESDFKNRINTRDEEKERILKLQQQLRNKQIWEEEISEEDTKKILELYDEQIMNLENEIKNNTALLEKYKKELEDEEG